MRERDRKRKNGAAAVRLAVLLLLIFSVVPAADLHGLGSEERAAT
jgi:hypothetical protein